VKYVGWWIVAGYFIATAGGLIFLWKSRGNSAEPENVLILFMTYNILYITLIGNTMGIGENNRFRFTVDPFIPILFVFFLLNLVARTRLDSLEKNKIVLQLFGLGDTP